MYILNSIKAISPVVATALLLVVAVVSVVGFQGWYNEFSSSVFIGVESDSSSSLGAVRVEGIIDNNLYLFSENPNIELNSLSVFSSNGSLACEFSIIGDVDESGLVGWWKFDDGSSVIKDYSLNGNDGEMFGVTRLLINFDNNLLDDNTSHNNTLTLTGITNYLSGSNCLSGSCNYFNGGNNIIEVDEFRNNNMFNKSFSVSLWTKINTTKNTNTFFSQGNDWTNSPNVNAGFGLGFRGSSNYIVGVLADGVNKVSIDNNSLNIRDGNFHNLIYDVNRDLNLFTIYYDGLLIGSRDISNLGTISSNNIFKFGSLGAHQFNGTMDEITVYSKSLSLSEISDLYVTKKAKYLEFKDSNLDKKLIYDGVNTYVKLPDLSSYITDGFGVFIKMKKIREQSTNNFIFGNYVGWGDGSVSLLFWTDDTSDLFHFRTQGISSSVGVSLNNPDLFDNEDLFFLNYDKNKVYMNIDSYGVSTNNLNQNVSSNDYWHIGFKSAKINGEIDEVRLYNRSLSESDMDYLRGYSKLSLSGDVSKIDLSSCSLVVGEKYNVLVGSDSGLIDIDVIAK